MTADYTPTTGDVIHAYQLGRTTCGCCCDLTMEDINAFQRWLAAHDREVAAKALEDAADRFGRNEDDEWGYWMDYQGWSVDPADPLRARAAAIREGGQG